MKNWKACAVLAALLGAAWVMPAWSQARPETQLKQRQAAMSLQNKYFIPIRNMAQGKVPYDANIVSRNVGFLDSLSKMPWDGFTPATQNLKSGATPAVFGETAKFKETQDRYLAEVSRLIETNRKGDEAATKAQIMAVDKACNTCHDTFREKQ